MRIRQRMATMVMKIKLFCLCLMMALFTTFTGHCQENETGISEDSLRELASQYYSDIRHWDVFVEPAVIMEEDTVFDKFGLKHAYFVNRYYYFAIPKKAGHRFMPNEIGPFLYAYGQKMPVEGKDNENFQMIRSAVFPFAAGASAELSSKKLFQQYADARLDVDIRHIDSLISVRLMKPDFLYYQLFDTAPEQNYSSQEEGHEEGGYNDWGRPQRHHSFDCLVGEYLTQYEKIEKPYSDFITGKPYKDLTSKENIEQLKKNAVIAENGFYLVPSRSILTAVAKNMGFYNDVTRRYFNPYYGYGLEYYCDQSEHIIGDMLRGDYYYYIAEDNEDDFTSITYYLINNQTIFLCHEKLDFEVLGECDASFSDLGEPTILAITPYGTKHIAVSDCLKDTNCTVTFFPPVIHVQVEKEKHDYSKEAMLQYLKEGSVLYDFFDNYYDKDHDYNGIEYNDSYHRATASLTATQCKKITKLLQKDRYLQYQKSVIEDEIMLIRNQTPYYLEKYFSNWNLREYYINHIDSACEKQNKKIEKQRKKLGKIDQEMYNVWKEIEKIVGHPVKHSLLRSALNGSLDYYNYWED